MRDVRARVPYSPSSLYAKIARGEFPKPIKLGANRVAWDEDDIDAWIDARAAATA